MKNGSLQQNLVRIAVLSFAVFVVIAAIVFMRPIGGSVSAASVAAVATYSRGTLHMRIPYHAPRAGTGQLTMEVIDPDDKVRGREQRQVETHKGRGHWEEAIRLDEPLQLEDLIWHRVRYRFVYDDNRTPPIEGLESISQIIRTPVLHIIGQQAYLAGGQAAVRVIATDSQNETSAGRGTVRIEFLAADQKPKVLYTGILNRRGTTEAQFQFPPGVIGSYQLRYTVDTQIGATEFTQPVRLEDKVSILLTTEKPIYQPGQIIHVRALALDRANHEASANHKLTFEVEDSRGNKVFKKATRTDAFGVASAEFALAEEVNLGTYHLRALMGEPDAPTNTTELALNVERYVLPKFKVAVEFSTDGKKQKRGYQPGDHVTGTVRAKYFFGKPVDDAGIVIKASSADVSVFDVAGAKGKTDSDGTYKFDLTLPKYFAGRPLSQGAARVLIEATVKDSAGHSETRGEPITVSESPLLITAVPEGGALAPNLENQVFVLVSYPDGSPAKAQLTINADGNEPQRVTTDESGVGVARIKAGPGSQSIDVEASDQEGNRTSSKLSLDSREGDEQILLRADRAVYRAGDRIHLKVFSTKTRGAAYIDVVKEGQTVLTRDVDLDNGHAELTLTTTPEMTGTVDFSAYLFGRDARPIGDHRLIFVQPADELKIETVANAPLYRPGSEARLQFRVTNSRGQGVHAALGLQVVDEAVFALAEKQPGFAKIFFYLEQEVMKPRYEIHSLSMPDVVDSSSQAKSEQQDRAAAALFATTEMVAGNKFETEYGRAVPMAKYGEYASRYQSRFFAQADKIAVELTRVSGQAPKTDDLPAVFTRAKAASPKTFVDAWGTEFRLEPAHWYGARGHYVLRSAGPDHRFNTDDDMVENLQVQGERYLGQANSGKVDLNVYNDRGPVNGLAEVTGTVVDPSGAVVPNTDVQLHTLTAAKIRHTRTDASGQFTFFGVSAGDYEVVFAAPGFTVASRQVSLHRRDRAVMRATLFVGSASEQVTVEASTQGVQTDSSEVSSVVSSQQVSTNGRSIYTMVNLAPERQTKSKHAADNSAVLADNKDAGASGAHVRSYFPEALYINPEVITDKDGRASIVIPMADSITTWRTAMIASTQHGALGTATGNIKVFQDFFVDLDLPVTLTQGDRVSLPVAIYNYSESRGDVALKLQADDWFSLVDNSNEKSVAVDPSKVAGAQYTIEAKRIGKFKLTLTARMTGKAERGDIVVREIEVIPNGREQSLVFNGRLENTAQHELNFPKTAIPEASKIFIRLYPGPLSQVVEGMDNILRMPGGCFEQTSSSTYPNVLALDYMKRTKKLTPEIHAKAEGFIASGYQRLLTFEVPGGGFSWFGQAPANKILTSYGLMEFSDMAKVYDIDPRLISRTQQWLANQQQEDGSWRPDTSFINEGATNRYNDDVLRITAYIGWALGNTGYQGPTVERAKQYVEKHMDGKADAYTLAVVANFAVDSKDRAFGREAIQLLLDARTEKDDKIWWTADQTSVYSTGDSAAIETTGLAVQALLKSGEASGAARKALTYLASKKDAYGTWGTTQATIMALRALLISTEKGTAEVRGTLQVFLNGEPVQKLELTPDNSDLLHQFVLKNIHAQSANNVDIRFAGTGGLAYQIAGTYFLPWDEKPEQEALSIDVAFDRTQLAQNDIATATATITNHLDKTANMVMVDLGIPPGFDLLSEDLQDYQEKSAAQKSGHLSKFSLTATQAILYFDSFAPGNTATIKYRLRAKYPVRARTFQSRVYEYYDPEVNAIARPVQFEVSGR